MIELEECNLPVKNAVLDYTDIKPRKHVQHLLPHMRIEYPDHIKGHPFPWAKRASCCDPALFAFKKFAKCLERDINPSLESEILEAGISHDVVLLNQYLKESIDFKRPLIAKFFVLCER